MIGSTECKCPRCVRNTTINELEKWVDKRIKDYRHPEARDIQLGEKTAYKRMKIKIYSMRQK